MKNTPNMKAPKKKSEATLMGNLDTQTRGDNSAASQKDLKTPFTFLMPESMREKIRYVVHEYGSSQTFIILKALEEYFQKHYPDL